METVEKGMGNSTSFKENRYDMSCSVATLSWQHGKVTLLMNWENLIYLLLAKLSIYLSPCSCIGKVRKLCSDKFTKMTNSITIFMNTLILKHVTQWWGQHLQTSYKIYSLLSFAVSSEQIYIYRSLFADLTNRNNS